MDCHKDIAKGTATAMGRGVTLWHAVVMGAWVLLLAQPGYAGRISTYESAVVTSDEVRLSDVASLSGFPVSQGQSLSDLVIASSPKPGKTSVILLGTIRDAIRNHGVNFAQLTIHGATRCQVSRMVANTPATVNAMADLQVLSLLPLRQAKVKANSPSELVIGDSFLSANSNGTLREAVVEFFQKELESYHGAVSVLFDKHSEQMLGLSGPGYQFRISRSSKAMIGLTSVGVDVVTGDKLIQTIPLAVNVTLTRSLLSTKRAINAKATIRAADIEIVPIVVTDLDLDMLDDPNMAIGLRANRFISQGTLVKPAMLESVPLVTRGRLVRLTSVAGGVSVVTAAKASESGHLGETIAVRSVENKRVEFPATVVGPGRVQIGGKLPKVMGVVESRGKKP